jgi:hypothetical protein
MRGGLPESGQWMGGTKCNGGPVLAQRLSWMTMKQYGDYLDELGGRETSIVANLADVDYQR